MEFYLHFNGSLLKYFTERVCSVQHCGISRNDIIFNVCKYLDVLSIRSQNASFSSMLPSIVKCLRFPNENGNFIFLRTPE